MSKKQIILGSTTSVQEVFSWTDGEDPLVLSLSNSSQFAPFAEGVALGVLRQVHLVGRPIVVRTSIEHPQQKEPDLTKFGPLKSLFGLAVAYQAQQVLNFREKDIRKQVITQNWTEVQQSQGHVGDSKRRYIVFRDPDYSVPHCLRDSARKTFPEPNQFAGLLRSQVLGLIGRGSVGRPWSESILISFLWEALRNSDLHGRFGDHGEIISGIRGCIVEKFAFSSWAEIGRRNLAPGLKRYLERIWTERTRQRILLAVTVADIGRGIQNTLPSLPSETAWDRLNRAFLPGVSRLPEGTNLRRGEGLTNIMEAAAKTKAFVFVCSADLAGYRDFSEPRQASSVRLTALPGVPARQGTSITILWGTSA